MAETSGYDYSNWDTSGGWKQGARPPDRVDWDTWDDEKKAKFGLPDWASFKKATDAFRTRFQPGGDIYSKNMGQETAIREANPQNEGELQGVMSRLGLQSTDARWKQLMLSYKGVADPSGRYHWNEQEGKWVDQMTSDLEYRGKGVHPGTEGQPTGPPKSGLDNIFVNEAAGNVARFKEWAASGNLAVSRGANGLFADGRGAFFDAEGFRTDESGKRTGGHYIAGGVADTMGVSAAGGGGGAGAAAGSGVGGGAVGGGGGDGISGQISEVLSQALSGEIGSMDEATVEKLKGAAKTRSEAMKRNVSASVDDDLVRRGIYSSPAGAAISATTDRAADMAYSAEAGQIEVQAKVQGFQDRMAGLDRAQRYLDSARSWALGQDQNDIARSQIALGYRRLESEERLTLQSFEHEMNLLQSRFNFDREMWEAMLPLEILERFLPYMD